MALSREAKDKLTVYGFIREIQTLLPHNKPHYIIPKELYLVVFEFYHFKIYFNQNLHNISQSILFANDTIARKYIDDEVYTHCLINKEISDTICKQFDITIKWTHSTLDFGAGFITIDAKEFAAKKSIIMLGCNNIQDCSKCVWIEQGIRRLYLYGNGKFLGDNTEDVAATSFIEGDTFTFSFDFVKDEWRVLHNHIEIQTLSLNGCKRLTPTFTLYEKDEEIEIIDYKYLY